MAGGGEVGGGGQGGYMDGCGGGWNTRFPCDVIPLKKAGAREADEKSRVQGWGEGSLGEVLVTHT